MQSMKEGQEVSILLVQIAVEVDGTKPALKVIAPWSWQVKVSWKPISAVGTWQLFPDTLYLFSSLIYFVNLLILGIIATPFC